MPCEAVGKFEKSVPWECLTTLAAMLKSGAPKGEVMQVAAQVLGQTGALLSPTMVGATGDDAELANLGDELTAAASMVAADDGGDGGKDKGADGNTAMPAWLLPILMRLLAKLLK